MHIDRCMVNLLFIREDPLGRAQGGGTRATETARNPSPSGSRRGPSAPGEVLQHSHLKKHMAVARATAGKVLASRRQPVRPPGTEHPPRAILAAHEVKHLDHLVSRSSYRVKLLLQLPKRVPAPSLSTGLALSSVDSLRRQGTQGKR